MGSHITQSSTVQHQCLRPLTRNPRPSATTTKLSQHVFLYDYSCPVPGLPYLHQYGTLHPWTWDYRRTLPAIRWSPHQTHSAPPASKTILPRSAARSAPLQQLLVTWQSCFLPVMGCQIMLSFYG